MKLLSEYLRDHNLTQAEFAGDVGCHPSRISHLVNGDKPTPDMAISIEKATAGELRCEDLCDSVIWQRDGDGNVTGYLVPVRPAA